MKLVTFFIAALFTWGGYYSAFGQSWLQVTNAPVENWWASACSADGNKLVAVYGKAIFNGGDTYVEGSIYTSTNFEVNWTQADNIPSCIWIAITSSADGQHLVAIPSDNSTFIYSSGDFGATWNPINTPSALLNCICSSADGNKLAAGEWNDFPPNPSLIYTSTNAGLNWTANNSPSQY